MAAFEAMCVVVLLGGFLGVAVVYNQQMLQRTRVVALQAELRNLRASVMLFQAKHGHLPQTLEDAQIAALGHLRAGGGSQSWPAPHEEPCIDPFGSPYRYDPNMGAVWSATAGFEQQ